MTPASPPPTHRHGGCRVLFGCLLALALLILPAGASAQPPGPKGPKVEIAADGTELFRALLDRKGIKPIKRADAWNIRNHNEVIVIVIGSPLRTDFGDPVSKAYESLNRGGATLIASDSEMSLGHSEPFRGGPQAFANIHGARIECTDESKVLAIKDPNNPDGPPVPLRDCPYVVPLTPNDVQEAPDPDSPIGRVFKGLDRIATNAPAYITTTGFTGEFRFALAKYPTGTIQRDFAGNRALLDRRALFAIGGDGEAPFNPYHFLAMADHSVFINQMLIEPGTDNLELAYRTIEFLQGPGGRKRCLFIENGRVVEDFDTLRKAFASQNPMPMPNLWGNQEKLTELGNKILGDVESRDVHNNLLLGLLGGPRGLTRLMWFVMVVASIYVTVYLLRRWIATRKPTDLPPPPAVAGAPSGPPGVFDRRQKELLRRDNIYEPVRDLVREFFGSLGIHGEQGPRHPKLVISDVVRKPDSLRQAIRDFWKTAFGPPQEVTVARWREMEPYLVRLREAHADGKWRFVMPGAPVAAPA